MEGFIVIQSGAKLQIYLEVIEESEYRLQYIKTLLFASPIEDLRSAGNGSLQIKISHLVKDRLTIEVNLEFWKKALQNPALERIILIYFLRMNVKKYWKI